MNSSVDEHKSDKSHSKVPNGGSRIVMWPTNKIMLLGHATSAPGPAAYDVKLKTNTRHSPFVPHATYRSCHLSNSRRNTLTLQSCPYRARQQHFHAQPLHFYDPPLYLPLPEDVRNVCDLSQYWRHTASRRNGKCRPRLRTNPHRYIPSRHRPVTPAYQIPQ